MKGFVFTDKISCVAGDCSVCKIGKDLIKIRVIRMHQNISILKKNFFFTELQNSSFGELFKFAADFFFRFAFSF